MASARNLEICGVSVAPGERCDVELPMTFDRSGTPVDVPVHVWRASQSGPTVFISGAVHGDEINGTGIIRDLLLNDRFTLETGSLVLVPVANIIGFDRHSRYMPDRRDLNRSFPGSLEGSMTSRFAHELFEAVVRRCDYGLDLHTAAVKRTNFPNIRADLNAGDLKTVAMAFGTEVVINTKGPKGSLRRAATDEGCPTIALEAGEVLKIEPAVVEFGVRGVRNVLIALGMVKGDPAPPAAQLVARRLKWVRADAAGFLAFHIAPGDVVKKGQPIATNTSLLGEEQNVINAPANGVIMGMTTLPAVVPGDPVCSIAVAGRGLAAIRDARTRGAHPEHHERVRDDLATSVAVSDVNGEKNA